MPSIPIPSNISESWAIALTLVVLGGAIWYGIVQAAVTLLNSRGTSMSNVISGYKTLVDQLQAQVNNLRDSYCALERRASDLEERVRMLERENEELRQTIEELKGENARLVEQLSRIRKVKDAKPNPSN